MRVMTWRKYSNEHYSRCLFDTQDIVLIDLDGVVEERGTFYNLAFAGVPVQMKIMLTADVVEYLSQDAKRINPNGHDRLATDHKTAVRIPRNQV